MMMAMMFVEARLAERQRPFEYFTLHEIRNGAADFTALLRIFQNKCVCCGRWLCGLQPITTTVSPSGHRVRMFKLLNCN